ncbi:hypothetical protein [Kribbella sp. NPDC048928]|uniref:hypothetical protein n=1 Tax=Kribbella sp. NPDC048928 TaxID=3364111 RepID=UPI00371076D5
MYDDSDLSRAVGLVARRSWVIKVGGIVALLALVSLLMLVPFGTSGSQVVAACPPGVGMGDDGSEGNGSLRANQVAFAKLIDDVAKKRGLPGQATLVALMTALQESQLQNLTGGDRDSLGLFQQRPSTGWGTAEDIMDPTYSADAFFGGSNPPSPPGLVDIDGWPSMSYNDAAQAVQRSGYPFAYAKQETAARTIATLAGIDLTRSGDPYAGRAGAKPGGDEGVVTSDDADDCGGGLISGKPINGVWPPEEATVTDPSGTGGQVTPRMAAWISQARAALGALSMGCWDAHAWNPTSDHPKGRACDVFVGTDARQSSPARANGDRIANWAVQNAARTGVHYVIWYGKIWSARTGQWKAYDGGGIYDTTSATGGHYDHVHVSVY